MLYLARVLYVVTGEKQRNVVLEVCAGVVNNIYPFGSEVHSMILLDEVYLSFSSSVKEFSEIINPQPVEGGDLYAYSPDDNGVLVALK